MLTLIKPFILIGTLLIFASSTALAASPVGKWRTIDDKSGKPKSIISIYPAGGTLQGRVVKLLPGATTTVCSKCPGKLKGKPIQGMMVMWGYKKSGSGWSGGRILDPKTGKVYKSNLKVRGSTLEVRGYFGISALGRTQRWQRVR